MPLFKRKERLYKVNQLGKRRLVFEDRIFAEFKDVFKLEKVVLVQTP